MVNLLIIEDATIRAMMVDPRIVQLLPCLTGAKQQMDGTAPGGKDCKKCKAEKNKIANDAMHTARQCIANARGARLDSLKTLLNARQLQLIAKSPSGRRTKYTL